MFHDDTTSAQAGPAETPTARKIPFEFVGADEVVATAAASNASDAPKPKKKKKQNIVAKKAVAVADIVDAGQLLLEANDDSADALIADELIADEMISNEMISNEMISNEMISNEMISDEMINDELVSEDFDSEDFDSEEEAIASDFETVVNEMSAFEELNLSPHLIRAIERSGYTIPTPIQAETIPLVIAGKDIIGQAETGSGKTAAFACPLLSQLDMSISAPQVLVLAPTRELAIQVTVAFQKYGEDIPNFRAVSIYGGQSYDTQLTQLRRGVQVVVGTPGRVMDHLRQGTLDLSNLKTFVLDEADEMLRMGFIDDVEWILEQLPVQRQILLFSATMPDPIKRIAQTHLKKPVTVSIRSNTATADSIQQSCIFVSPRDKMTTLAQILESEETDGVIVFVKTRNTTVLLADQLTQRGFSAAPLNGEIAQNQRERTITQLKNGRLNVLVATDVAARGLDVQRVSHVINYDFPHDTEAYVHRIGRTGRAGRTGAAVLFVEPKEKGKLSRLQRATNQKISTFHQKSLHEINLLRIEKFKQRITTAIAETSGQKLFEKIVAEYHEETGTPIEQIATALAQMAQGDVQLLLTQVVAPQSNFKDSRDSGRDSSGRDSHSKRGQRSDGPMTTYRIEVGRDHGVGPGNIVGAITNEGNLDNSVIGRIKLFDSFSTIDLSADVDARTIEQLGEVVVSGQRLRISKDRSPQARFGSDRGDQAGPRQSPRRKGNNGSTKFGKKPSSDSRDWKSKDKATTYKASPNKTTTYAGNQTTDRPVVVGTDGESKPARPKTKLERGTFGKSVMGKKAYGDKAYADKPYEKKSYGEKASADKPYAKKSYAKKTEGVARTPASSSGAKAAMEKRKTAARKFVKIRGTK